MDNSMNFPGTKNRSVFKADRPFIFVILSVFGYSHVIFTGRIVALWSYGIILLYYVFFN